MRIHIIRHGLELLQQLLGLIDDGLVLQDGAVVRDIDGGGLRGVLVVDELGVVVPFAEGLEGGDGLWWSVGEVKRGRVGVVSGATNPFRDLGRRIHGQSPGMSLSLM